MTMLLLLSSSSPHWVGPIDLYRRMISSQWSWPPQLVHRDWFGIYTLSCNVGWQCGQTMWYPLKGSIKEQAKIFPDVKFCLLLWLVKIWAWLPMYTYLEKVTRMLVCQRLMSVNPSKKSPTVSALVRKNISSCFRLSVLFIPSHNSDESLKIFWHLGQGTTKNKAKLFARRCFSTHLSSLVTVLKISVHSSVCLDVLGSSEFH